MSIQIYPSILPNRLWLFFCLYFYRFLWS